MPRPNAEPHALEDLIYLIEAALESDTTTADQVVGMLQVVYPGVIVERDPAEDNRYMVTWPEKKEG